MTRPQLVANAERERQQRLILAGIAHDLGQPLTALEASTELLRRDPSPERRTRLLETNARAVARLRRMRDDWVALARGTSSPDLTARPVDPVPLLKSIAQDHGDRFAGGLSLEHPPALPLIRADPQALERILGNLLDNAAKYGGARVRLVVAADDGAVRFSVLDRGPGLPPGDPIQLFAAFARGDDAPARGHGHGLGLAVVEMLVRAQGGYVRAENLPGGGAAFHITIPRA
jgi:signal transduction histidine kinase